MIGSKRVKLIVILIITLCSMLALLSFGNPGWSKYVYMFQAYVYPKDVRPNNSYLVRLKMPEKFSGIWKEYSNEGNLLISSECLNGKLHGIQKEFNKTGESIIQKTVYDNGSVLVMAYYDDGKLYTFWDHTLVNKGNLYVASLWKSNGRFKTIQSFYEIKKDGSTYYKKNGLKIGFDESEKVNKLEMWKDNELKNSNLNYSYYMNDIKGTVKYLKQVKDKYDLQ
jgi:antitoxin component YwqK of YwqJK toxin-antitoxin module